MIKLNKRSYNIDGSKTFKEKYYKITNENEKHNGYQYKDGLNVLDESVKKIRYGSQVGFSFTDVENIFKFLDFGHNLREITLPDTCKLVKYPDGHKFRTNQIIFGKKYDLKDPNTFKMLIEHGANIHDGHAIRWAAQHGRVEVVRCLLEKGVNIDVNNNCAIKGASMFGHIETVSFLVENGVDIHADDNYAILEASGNGHIKVVNYLVENGADIYARDNEALRNACMNGFIEVVKYLVENGADIHARDNEALLYACLNGHLDVVRYLAENGADIHARNDYVIKRAAQNGHFEIVRYLMFDRKNVNIN